MKKILVTGATGQLGSELVPYLRNIYGVDNVIASDINTPCDVVCDVLDLQRFESLVRDNEVDTLIHLAALLSAKAESHYLSAWHLNMQGLINGLELAKKYQLQFFSPSSIGAFGQSPAMNTPQHTIMRPSSIYGITKVAGELLCDYYHEKFGVDTRSVRFPGLISSVTLPGGGTTDYAVEIFYEAIKHQKYTCPLRKDTRLDMMYMEDALRLIVDLMEADGNQLTIRNAYNVSSMAFTPDELAESIKEYIPEFTIEYEVDELRQSIADSWPDQMDVSLAKADFNFTIQYDLKAMTEKMLEDLKKNQKTTF